jgi:sterol desaturase/sphingolipid hydroxylase (fatty acid hydroxylase superfamily)
MLVLGMVTVLLVHVATYWIAARQSLGDACAAPADRHATVGVVACVLQNQLIWTPLVAVPLLCLFPPPCQTHGAVVCLWQAAGCVVLTDAFFYAMHRLFHCNFLYRFHARHHGWAIDRPEGFASYDAHPLEHAFVNVLPVLAAALVMRCDWVVLCLWVAAATASGVSAHDDPAGKHALHHKHRSVNFGVGPMLLDRAMGTFAQGD